MQISDLDLPILYFATQFFSIPVILFVLREEEVESRVAIHRYCKATESYYLTLDMK